MARLVLTGLAFLWLPSLASAQGRAPVDFDRIESRGEARSDARDARTEALDSAFAEALTQALAALLDREQQRRHQADIAERIVRRARRYIRSYRVLEESSQAGRYQLRITARVDESRVRDTLTELGIDPALMAPAADAGGRRGGALRAALFVRVVGPDRSVWQSFGSAPARGSIPPAGARALAELVREQGMTIVEVGPVGEVGDAPPEVPRDAADALPLSDDDAYEAARAAGADVAVVAAIGVGEARRVRGTALFGAASRARIRVLDAGSRRPGVVADASVEAGGFAREVGEAGGRSAAQASRQLFAAVADAVSAHWPPRAGSEELVLLEIRGHRRWQSVAAIISHLSRSGGIERVWPRWVGADGLILAIASDAIGDRARRRVAELLRRLDLSDAGTERVGDGTDGAAVETSLEVDTVGDDLRVTLRERSVDTP